MVYGNGGKLGMLVVKVDFGVVVEVVEWVVDIKIIENNEYNDVLLLVKICEYVGNLKWS